jgi:hypothetical protein
MHTHTSYNATKWNKARIILGIRERTSDLLVTAVQDKLLPELA